MLVDRNGISTLTTMLARVPTALVARTVAALLRICTDLPRACDRLRANLESDERAVQLVRDLAAEGDDKAKQLLQMVGMQADPVQE